MDSTDSEYGSEEEQQSDENLDHVLSMRTPEKRKSQEMREDSDMVDDSDQDSDKEHDLGMSMINRDDAKIVRRII